MGFLFNTFRAGASMFSWAGRTGATLGDGLAVRTADARSRASRRARRSGVLAPGDRPGGATGFLDYRGVGLPHDYPGCSDAVVRVGDICHPHGNPRTPMWLGWGTLNRHAAVIAPTGSGKTISVMAPWISEAMDVGITVVAVDVKGDLLDEVRRVRGGRPLPPVVRRWDISRRHAASVAWNPLDEVRDENALQSLVTALLGEVDPKSEHKHFQERDHRWLGGLLRLVIAGIPDPTLEMAHALLKDRASLRRFASSLPGDAVNVSDLVSMPDGDYGLATSGLLNALAWTTHGVARAATERSDFSVDECLSDGGLTIVGAPVGSGVPPRAAAAAFVGMLRNHMFSGFGGDRSPVLLVLDEVDKYADRIELSALLDLARAANVGIVLGLQNVDQLGRDAGEVETRLGNCATLIVLPGATDRTAKYFASRLGQHTVETVTYGVDAHGRRVPTTSAEHVDVLGTREIMHPPLGEWTALVYSKPLSPKPFLVDLTRDVAPKAPTDAIEAERDGLEPPEPTSARSARPRVEITEGSSLKGRGLAIGAGVSESASPLAHADHSSSALKGKLARGGS